MEVNSKRHNISGLSFKDLSSEISESKEKSFIFLDEDISNERDLKGIDKYVNFLLDKFNAKRGVFAFIIDFGKYVFSRLRVVWILVSVLFEIFYRQFNLVKQNIVKRMFWGRGSFLKYAIESAVIVIAFILILSYIYRTPTIISANSENLDYISAAEVDIFAMNATLNTAIPKDRGRRGTETYIVMHGDTLSTIAAKYQEVSIESIKWANNLSSDLVKPGQELEIPPADGVLISVKKGDTLSSLAKKYSGNEQAIADFNWLEYPFTLVEGEKLFIPDGRMPEPVKPKFATAPKTYISGSTNPTSSASSYVDPNVGRFLRWPVAGGSAKISQYFRGTLHRGIDIADKSLPNVLAAAGGKIIFAGCAGYCPSLGSTYGGSSYGWAIQVDHGNGYTTWYAHLKNIYVRTGQTVSAGQSIGQMGSTGRSTGPHLHFELRRGVAYGTQINPLLYSAW
jgi:murein DD-endopeptidase MepM/ murein hydrolase activator NlpD